MERLSEALNLVYSASAIPMHFTAEYVASFIRDYDIVPELCSLWHDENDATVAAALVGARGQRGWLGAFGIAPDYRGRGLASGFVRETLAVSQRERLATMQLECLDSNVAARRAYEGAGFKTLRSVIALAGSLPVESASISARTVASIEREEPRIRPTWQREPDTLRHRAADLKMVTSDDGHNFIIFRAHDGEVQIVRAETDDDAALGALLYQAGRETGFDRGSIINEPDDSPLIGRLERLGWGVFLRQAEMMIKVRFRG